ncbi:MAG: hypothetical protein HYS60_01150 [Candidatus Wildermuthbacteria bacterium]|nr:hypothetical protein [Candidatus Wildermuthbacteria bacterium]
MAKEQQKTYSVSPLDPDFLVMAALAILVDVLDWVFEIGTIVSLIIGGFFIWWLVKRTGQSVSSQEVQAQHAQQQEQRQLARAGAKRALRRGILMFVMELIPLVNLIPFWTIFVFSALREQSQESEPVPAQAAT